VKWEQLELDPVQALINKLTRDAKLSLRFQAKLYQSFVNRSFGQNERYVFSGGDDEIQDSARRRRPVVLAVTRAQWEDYRGRFRRLPFTTQLP
jgi:hypothetical protein